MGQNKARSGLYLLQTLACIWGLWIEATTLAFMWAWFAVPVGLPAIGKAHVFGLALIVSLATARFRVQEDDTNEIVLQRVLWLAWTSPLYLLMGYAAHLIMSP